jgi:hypothetical protein
MTGNKFFAAAWMILLLIVSPGILPAAPDNNTLIHSVKTEIDEISVIGTDTGARYSLNNDLYIDQAGAPEIPYKLVRLALPINKSLESFSVSGLNIQIIARGESYSWYEGDIKTDIYENHSPAARNETIYGSAEFYPGKYAEIVDKGVMGSLPLVTFAVYPIQYRPGDGSVILTGDIEIKIKLKDDFTHTSNRMPAGADLIINLIDNSDQITAPPSLNSPAGGGDVPGTTILGVGAEYIIVTSGELAPAFYPYAFWKNQKGLATEIVLIEDILSSYSGEDPAAQLRSYLQEAYQQGAQWLLLGGDEEVLPIRYAFPGNVSYMPAYHDLQIADIYFSDLTGDWDVDGDGVYGEYNHDDPDMFPELYVGRIVTADYQKVVNWVEKAIMYEQNPGNGDYSYLTRGLFIIADQMRDYNQHTVLASLMPDHFFVDASRCAEEPSGGSQTPTQPTGEQVIEIMNEGWGFISNLNHGSFSNYSLKTPGYNNPPRSYMIGGYYVPEEASASLMMLEETTKYGIHYSISCYNAMFDFDQEIWVPGPFVTRETLMETYLFMANKGGVAYLGNTRWGWVTSSYLIEQKFIQYVFSDTARQLAVAEALSKLYYPTKRDLCYGHNLFGDPEMRIWAYEPIPLSVVVPGEITTGSDDLVIRVSTPDGSAAGVKVCLWKPGELYIRGLTDSEGRFETAVALAEPGELYVTASGQDMLPSIDTVAVHVSSGIDNDPLVPAQTYLGNNYPNPFNPTTDIQFAIADPDRIKLEIYDITGRKVKTLIDSHCSAGTHEVRWDGVNENGQPASAGMYLYRLSTSDKDLVKKMVLLK